MHDGESAAEPTQWDPRRPWGAGRIVLGVSGGIAAYKAVEVCRRLVDAGAHVESGDHRGATRFVGAVTFSAWRPNRSAVALGRARTRSPTPGWASVPTWCRRPATAR